MAERVKLINPECVVNIIDDFISPDNQAEYLNRGYDYVIDAIDNVKTKAAMIAYCKRNKIKIILSVAQVVRQIHLKSKLLI